MRPPMRNRPLNIWVDSLWVNLNRDTRRLYIVKCHIYRSPRRAFRFSPVEIGWFLIDAEDLIDVETG